jgi:hypothetical protein
MQLGIGSGQPNNVGGFAPDASVIRVPIFCVGAVETKPTAMTTESKTILMIFDMRTLLVVDQISWWNKVYEQLSLIWRLRAQSFANHS